MSVHDACTLYAVGCLRNISSVSPWYPLIGIPMICNWRNCNFISRELNDNDCVVARMSVANAYSILANAQNRSRRRVGF